MLIYNEKRLIPTDINMQVIKGREMGYFYIHRLLYDQTVILNELYGSDINMLIRSIDNLAEMRDDVAYFIDNVPEPINILGPFLLLVKEPLTDIKDMVGALHVMSGPINFRRMLKVPRDVRNSVPRFSLSIKEEYQLAWDRFLQTTIPYSADLFTRVSGSAPMNGVATSFIEEGLDVMADAAAVTAAKEAEATEEVTSFEDVDITDEDAVTAAVTAMAEDAEFDADNVSVDDLTGGMDEAALTALMNMNWDFGDVDDLLGDGTTTEETTAEAPAPVDDVPIAPQPEQKAPTGVDALLSL